YVADDYPMRLPLELGSAQATFDCSARYMVNTNISREVWSKSTDTQGGGFVRLGEDYRVFAVSMFHQLHCISALHTAITMQTSQHSDLGGHVQHCLNYLRQFILCSADDTVEPVVTLSRLQSQGCAAPFTRTCRNWERLYDFSAANYLEFHQYK
ncbi:hypothetical protein M422DRAFT_134417, partial [Sphaerobolus stellatus SS14]